MNAKQLSNLIATTCSELYSLGLLFTYNNPCVRDVTDNGGHKYKQVSWPTMGSGSATLHSFGALEQYLEWVRDGEFTCLLFDYSLIRASYNCEGNEINGHSLLYWPCPVEFIDDIESLTDLSDGIELCLESPLQAKEIVNLTMRTPMRFDFDPIRASNDHPLIHLHTQFDDTRIAVQQPMSFPSFMKKVLCTFYRNKQELLPEIEKIYEPVIKYEDVGYDLPPHAFQIFWRQRT